MTIKVVNLVEIVGDSVRLTCTAAVSVIATLEVL
jgi:hypothetical protein